MSDTQDTTIYARLSDDKKTVVEYPVFGLHITNRAHPFDWYSKVVFDPKPEVPEFHSAKEVQTIRDGQLFISYQVVADSLNQVLSQIGVLKNLPGMIVPQPLAIDIKDVPEAHIARVKKLAEQYAQTLLDEFAAMKGYDSIDSATKYHFSKNATFKADAEKCSDLLDQVWVRLPIYFEKIMIGEVPIPKTQDDIKAQLPEMVW